LQLVGLWQMSISHQRESNTEDLNNFRLPLEF
jgi:hypothetical protein